MAENNNESMLSLAIFVAKELKIMPSSGVLVLHIWRFTGESTSAVIDCEKVASINDITPNFFSPFLFNSKIGL